MFDCIDACRAAEASGALPSPGKRKGYIRFNCIHSFIHSLKLYKIADNILVRTKRTKIVTTRHVYVLRAQTKYRLPKYTMSQKSIPLDV